MIYTLSKDFTQITETTGTIQNASHIYTLEMSQSNTKGSGIFIYPLQSTSFNNKTIYLRCVDGAGAEARVLPFTNGSDDTLTDIFQDIFANVFRDVSLDNGVVSFLNSNGQVVKYFNLPEEIFLRTIGTTFVPSFTWSALAYPNSTNPNLNVKPVLVLHIKGDSLDNPYEDWGFCNLEDLIDLYVPADASIAISNNSIRAAISSANDNLLSLKDDGLFAGDDTTNDISDFRSMLSQSFGFNQGS